MSSYRQKSVAQKISEILRNPMTAKCLKMGSILRSAGYSKQTSLKPKLVTNTKGYQFEIEKILEDEKILKIHRDLLNSVKLKKVYLGKDATLSLAKEIIEATPDSKVRNLVKHKDTTTCFYWSPDGPIRKKALDLFYRLKGYY